MVHVALLRGVNVGGANKIAMRELKTVFEAAGLELVRTYINSGNVIFSTEVEDRTRLVRELGGAIEKRFGFAVRMLVLNGAEMRSVVGALPEHWANDDARKCDVLFLWGEVDSPSILEQLEWDPDLEDVRYTPGAVIRCVARKDASRSRITRIVGTSLYRQITIRNCNTARRLLQLMEEAGAQP